MSKKSQNNELLKNMNWEEYSEQLFEHILEYDKLYEKDYFLQEYGTSIACYNNKKKVFHNHLLKTGEPLQHIISLAEIASKILEGRFPKEHLNDICSLIFRWFELETKFPASFYFSTKQNSDIKDFYFPMICLDKLTSVGIKLVLLKSEHGFLLIENLYNLQKLLSAQAEYGCLQAKKHREAFLRFLDVKMVDCFYTFVQRYLQQDQYLEAEIYINKVLEKSRSMHKDAAPISHFLSLGTLAFIALKEKNYTKAIELIDEIKSLKGEEFSLAKVEHPFSCYVQVCKLIGDHFFLQEKAKEALEYYLEAYNNANAEQHKVNLEKKLNGACALLTLNIKNSVQDHVDQGEIAEVKAWPKNKVFILYMNNSSDTKYMKKTLAQKNVNYTTIKKIESEKDKNAIAFTVDKNFSVDDFYFALDKLKAYKLKKEQAQQKVENTLISKALPKEPVNPGRRPSHFFATTSSLYKVGKKVKGTTAVVSPQERNSDPTALTMVRNKQEDVHFDTVKRYFTADESKQTGVVSLVVNGRQGTWYACLDENILEELNDEKLKVDLIAKFNTKLLTTDYIVPCYKEMQQKSKMLNTKLPYAFKIRLPNNGIGDARLYAEIIEITSDGKRLVQFNAYNPKSHSKHTIPKKARHNDDEEISQIKCEA